MIKIGTIIDDRYEILKEIGRGGMSIVYLAMDNRLNKSLVVKDIRKRKNSNTELLINSLIIEANMLKKLDHGALPKIYDIIESEGDIYVVMDYIEGESLKEKMKDEKTMPVHDVIEWAKQLSGVLGYLHTRKPHPIIYRDMKPDNIMLTPEGKIKLVDFGIAREFKTENVTDTTNLGTKGYAAPEQLSSKQTDTRTDIYSLGVTLYHLVTGKSLSEPPFEIKPIRHWNPSLPEGLERIINKCTQAEPDKRYQSCEDLSWDLHHINKLTKGYKNKLRKELALFLIPVALLITFSTTSILGYNGIKREQFQNYVELVNDASKYTVDGNIPKATELLERAITMVDNERAEAYINLLDLYIDKKDTDIGLSKIETYINNQYGHVHKNNEVLFKMGMTYFDIKKDYMNALKYFRQVNMETIPDVQYYKSLATMMSSMNIDYKVFESRLNAFEKYNDNLPNDGKKVDNYNSLANVYFSYKSQMSDANTEVIQLIQKAREVLSKVDSEQLQFKYEIEFEQKLAQSYHSRGVNSKDKEAARMDFERAIEHYHTLIDLNVTDKEDVMVKMAVAYQDMGQVFQAIERLQQAIKEYPQSKSAYIKLNNMLLDLEQSKEEDTRSYTEVKRVYEQVSRLKGIEEDEAYNKLKRRLSNLKVI